MKRRTLLLGLIGLVIVLGGAWVLLSRPQKAAPLGALPAIFTPDPGFTRVTSPITLNFPKDDGPHPAYQTEWWYYTGNLQTSTGRHFGFELTFFRRALQPPSETPTRTSDLAASQVYMAHLALTDVQAGSFKAFERFSRGAGGLAGAQGSPVYSVWLEDWQVSQVGVDQYKLQAANGDIALNLTLDSLKEHILQGDGGYSQKGLGAGNASIYTSQTRLQTNGTIQTGGQKFTVTGFSWMDHEFSTSALSQDEVGWDWFALQLDDGSELTIYAIRRADGTPDPYARGTLVRADGSIVTLRPVDFSFQAQGEWTSPSSGARYPAGWKIQVPALGIDLTVSPYIPDQELRLSFVYWEGAARVTGVSGGKNVTGSGYVELTGYAHSMAGQF